MSFARNLSKKYGKKMLGIGVNASKSDSQRVTHKGSEAIGDFLGNKIANTFVEPVEEIIILSEKTEEILNELRQVLN